jgi:hypothetical protein
MKKLSYYVAIIDEASDFVTRLEPVLTEKIKDFGIEVKGFTNIDNFKKAISLLKNEIAILAIADSSSYSPSVEDGPFVFLKNEVPIAKGVLYTTDPTRKEWQRFIDMGIVTDNSNIIKRQDNNNQKSISEIIVKNINLVMTLKSVISANNLAEKLPENPSDIELEMVHNIATGKEQVYMDCVICKDFKTHENDMNKIGVNRIPDMSVLKEANNFDANTYKLLTSGEFGKYIKKKKLNGIQKFIFQDLVRYRLNYLSKNQEIENKLKVFFENDQYNCTSDAWRIYKTIYTDIMV